MGQRTHRYGASGGDNHGQLRPHEVWVDGVKKFTESASTSFTTSIALGGGKHRFDIYSVNTAGTKYLTTVYATVN